MSKFITPPLYSERALELQWKNTIFNSHDLFCGCNDTTRHLISILATENKQLCLPSTSTEDATTQTGGDEIEDILDEGDLDALFAEDFGDADG